MKGYTYAHVLKERGFVEVPKEYLIPRHEEKRAFVEAYLEPAIINANCGWASVKYILMKHSDEGFREYVVLASNAKNPMDGRYVEVTANSKGSIISEVAENLW